MKRYRFNRPTVKVWRHWSRLDRALRRVANHHAVSRVVVSHGVAGRVIRVLYLGLSTVEAFRLDAPQNALFRLSGGECTRILLLD